MNILEKVPTLEQLGGGLTGYDERQRHNLPSKTAMSRASITFASSIEDATALLAHFDNIHKQTPESAEVLKRAGLVMALTAWETYVEDRVQEAVQSRLRAVTVNRTGFRGGLLA